MRTKASTAARRLQKILSLDGIQLQIWSFKVNSATSRKNRIVCYPLLMRSDAESERVWMPVGAWPSLVWYWFGIKMSHSVLCLNWEHGGDSVWVLGGWCGSVWMRVGEVKGQLSSLFHVKVCRGDVKGGSQNVRENLWLLFCCLCSPSSYEIKSRRLYSLIIMKCCCLRGESVIRRSIHHFSTLMLACLPTNVS